MKTSFLLSLVVTCLLMAGCAGTSIRVQTEYRPVSGEKFTYEIVNAANMSEEGLVIIRQRLNYQLASKGLLATGPQESGRKAEVAITNYYMRHGATRALVGVMAGADNIVSSIKIKDAKTSAVLGEFVVESKNPTAVGTSRGLIEEHVDLIAQYLQTGRP
jgi:uncharacterized protein DUF4410